MVNRPTVALDRAARRRPLRSPRDGSIPVRKATKWIPSYFQYDAGLVVQQARECPTCGYVALADDDFSIISFSCVRFRPEADDNSEVGPPHHPTSAPLHPGFDGPRR